MEQFNLTNAGYNEQELSEQELAEIMGGNFFKSLGRGIVKVAKGAGRFARDGAAVIGVTTIVNGFTQKNGGQ
jgi:bacteriocin-like protein